jgi:hypothetical protein
MGSGEELPRGRTLLYAPSPIDLSVAREDPHTPDIRYMAVTSCIQDSQLNLQSQTVMTLTQR